MQDFAGRAITVYLVDDHDIVRRGLRDLLAPARDIHVVGDSGSAQRAASAVPDLRPDVVVLDLQLQDGNGIEVCRRVRAVVPDVRALLLTSAADDDALVATILAGASGYLVKLSSNMDIVSAVRRLGAGRPLLDPEVRARAAHLLDARAAELVPPFGDRERTVLTWVVEGLTDDQVAERSGSSVAEAAAEVAAVVRRVGPSLDGSGPSGGSVGRHRRDPG